MTITPYESEAYKWAVKRGGEWDFPSVLRDALRDHLAAEMRLEFEKEHREGFTGNCVICVVKQKHDSHHNYTEADWNRAADEALKGERK